MPLISKQQIDQFHELGYFVTTPQFSDTQIMQITDEFTRLWKQNIEHAKQCSDEKQLELARLRAFIGQAHTRSEVLAEVVKAPIYLEACSEFIGPDADLYYNQIVIKAPLNGRPFAWHQDSGYQLTKPLSYVTCWTAITPATLENGCVWVIPGSHKWGVLPHQFNESTTSTDAVFEDDSTAVAVPMEPGQIAIFSSLTLHRTGPNTSAAPRYAYVPQYHVPQVVTANGNLWGDQFPVLRDGVAV